MRVFIFLSMLIEPAESVWGGPVVRIRIRDIIVAIDVSQAIIATIVGVAAAFGNAESDGAILLSTTFFHHSTHLGR